MQNNSTFRPKKAQRTTPMTRIPMTKAQRGNLSKKTEKQVARKQKAAKGNFSVGGKTITPYVCTLIDPENCHGVRYPDDLPKGTAVFRGLINHNAYYFPTSNIEPAGFMLNVLNPTLINPLLEYRTDVVTTTFSAQTQEMQVLNGGCASPDDQTGLFPLTEDVPTSATSADQMWLAGGSLQNFRCQWHWRDQDFSIPPFRGKDPSGDVFYGIPVGLDVAAGTPGLLTVYVTMAQPLVAAVNPFTVQAVTTLGVVNFTSGAGVVGSTVVSFTASATTLAGLTSTSGYAAIPGMGFRILNNTSKEILLTSYTIGIITENIGAGSVDRDQGRFVGVPLPDESTYAQTIDQYRVVSMMNWAEYDGSDLNNGGQIASILYRGGQSAAENGLYSYQAIAEAPESYAGPLKHGTFTIWAPNSDNDMLMRGLSPHGRWQYPFIANAAVIATPSQINAVRLRIAINYEVVSTSQFYDFEKPVPFPESIRQAALLLREHPATMANGKHWDWIKGVVKDAVDLGRGVGKWAKDNESWLIPAASSIGALLL